MKTMLMRMTFWRILHPDRLDSFGSRTSRSPAMEDMSLCLADSWPMHNKSDVVHRVEHECTHGWKANTKQTRSDPVLPPFKPTSGISSAV